MGTNKIITLMDGYKEVGNVEVICAFEVPELSGKYIIYTKNEKDRDGNTIIYSGKISKKNNKQYIKNIEEELTIEFPRIYYLGYRLTDNKNNTYKLTKSNNGLLSAKIKNDGTYKSNASAYLCVATFICLKSALT